MPSNLSFSQLSPAAQRIVASYAERRGVARDDLDDFLDPKLRLDSYRLPDAEKVLARLNRAIVAKERMLIFGDYDMDGMSSAGILLRFFRELTKTTPSWSLPSRQSGDNYGLDVRKAKELCDRFRPSLLICLDCGTNSFEAIDWLKTHGVDTIVVDHHPPETATKDAVALVNPKVYKEQSECRDLCAAGLTFVLCASLAKGLGCVEKWDRATATVLAGLATLADEVPMTPLNRCIAKTALAFINTRQALNRVIGLAELIPADGRRISQRQLEFQVIPAINALGRLDSPEPGVRLLTTTNAAEAAAIAMRCLELNAARKAKQVEMVDQAEARARAVLGHHPETQVLVLADRQWHHGIAGPAASQIAERFGRSAILLAPNGTDGQWKGSGRSRNGDDLGAWIRAVKALGLIERGGGHAAAVGLAVTSAQIAALQSAALATRVPRNDDAGPESEILGELDELGPEEWLEVTELLEPFGQGNPVPRVVASNALCRSRPLLLNLKNNGRPWGVKATFQTEAGQVIAPVSRDVTGAQAAWVPGQRYDLELELTAKSHNGQRYFNWVAAGYHDTKLPASSRGGRLAHGGHL